MKTESPDVSKPTTYRCDPRVRVSKNPYGKQRVQNLSKERVYELVREIVLVQKERAIKEAVLGNISLTAEELAAELNVGIHKVAWALQQLNLKGLVTQRLRSFAHDTNRNPMFLGPSSGWSASHYRIVLPLTSDYNWPRAISPKPKNCPEGSILVWDEQEPRKKGRFSKRLGYRLLVNV